MRNYLLSLLQKVKQFRTLVNFYQYKIAFIRAAQNVYKTLKTSCIVKTSSNTPATQFLQNIKTSATTFLSTNITIFCQCRPYHKNKTRTESLERKIIKFALFEWIKKTKFRHIMLIITPLQVGLFQYLKYYFLEKPYKSDVRRQGQFQGH